MYEKNPQNIESSQEEYPIQIPAEIMEVINQHAQELNDPDLSRERWGELNEEHRKKMSGNSDEDLYYQLHVYRQITSQGNDGIKIKIHDLEQALKPCFCGSGKKYKKCHG